MKSKFLFLAAMTRGMRRRERGEREGRVVDCEREMESLNEREISGREREKKSERVEFEHRKMRGRGKRGEGEGKRENSEKNKKLKKKSLVSVWDSSKMRRYFTHIQNVLHFKVHNVDCFKSKRQF